MTLLLNYRLVPQKATGIGMYANGILPSLQQLPHCMIPGSRNSEGGLARFERLLWTQTRLPRIAKEYQASLIFTPGPEGYLGHQATPQVVMVHDLRPISHPERSLQSLYFRSWVPALLSQCHHILTNSHYTAQEIMRHTEVPRSRLSVISLGYNNKIFHPQQKKNAIRPARPEGMRELRPYLLHVGQAYPHKNLARLIKVFARIAIDHTSLKLILAGKSHPRETPRLHRLARELGVGERVLFAPYVPQEQLPNLYRGATAFVFPSLWEGFGLPVLEAMACGTPVLTSLGSGTEEAAGEAALLVDPFESREIEQGLRALLTEPSLRRKLRQRGLARAQMFSWSQCGEETLKVVQSLL